MSDPSDGLLGAQQSHDLDGDGYEETVVEFFDDGASIATYDLDADGSIDAVDLDADGDSEVDLAVVLRDDEKVLVVTDPSGADSRETVSLDDAEDLAPGLVDLLGDDHGRVDLGDVDTTGVDGADDRDGDRERDRERARDDDRNQDRSTGDDGRHPQGDPDDATVIGDPFGDADLWFEQAVNGTCAPATVAQIVSEYTGQQFVDEQQFVDMAIDSGAMEVYPDGSTSGMYAPDIVELLNDAGVPADLEEGLGLDDLKGYLADDVSVAVMVDADEYWNPMYGMPEEDEDDLPNHIVLVTGIDEAAGVVYVNDTGTPDGEALEVPIDYFLDAWDDSGSQAVVCEEPAPGSGTVDVVDSDDHDSGGRDQDVTGVAGAGLAPAETVSQLVDGSWALLPVVLSGEAAAAAPK